MIISDDKVLQDIQREFYERFPYLKLEFYHGHHEKGEGSPNWQMIPSSKTIGEVRKIHTKGDLKIHDDLTVEQLEKTFYDQYGLNVQVWRKSGTIWLQTTSTDSWTLAEQNERGKQSVIHPV